MDETHWIYLNRTQIVDAIAADFEQYGPQPSLFEKLTTVLAQAGCQGLGPQGLSAGRVSGLWAQKVGFYLVHLLETGTHDLEILAEAAGLVFETQVQKDVGGKGIWVKHGMADFECAHCGRCCTDLAIGGDCTLQDIRRWQAHGRQDILAYVKKHQGRWEIWVDPGTQEALSPCPFLFFDRQTDRHLCRIHSIKPDTCQQYPFTPKHGSKTGCCGSFPSPELIRL